MQGHVSINPEVQGDQSSWRCLLQNIEIATICCLEGASGKSRSSWFAKELHVKFQLTTSTTPKKAPSRSPKSALLHNLAAGQVWGRHRNGWPTSVELLGNPKIKSCQADSRWKQLQYICQLGEARNSDHTSLFSSQKHGVKFYLKDLKVTKGLLWSAWLTCPKRFWSRHSYYSQILRSFFAGKPMGKPWHLQFTNLNIDSSSTGAYLPVLKTPRLILPSHRITKIRSPWSCGPGRWNMGWTCHIISVKPVLQEWPTSSYRVSRPHMTHSQS